MEADKMIRKQRALYVVPFDSPGKDDPYRVVQTFVSEDGSRILTQDWWPSVPRDPFTTLNTATHVPTGRTYTWRSIAPPWPDDIGARIAMQVWPIAAKLGGFTDV